ncbi:PREDICTED: fatty-acid amide hydrolase 2-A-like isoform X1 [Polistes canadensis]|uniref:fatty-acid amide hydrolase 2-A-like isoform X1 n=2 Tax=Polistes canadensis TaxID=91411 RepID=UPI000718B30B|nr:PREDICTED: fatty-acid amide hydrolase 2-A-like isoform X1 [Polistes canadensis]
MNVLSTIFPLVLFGITFDYWTIIHPLVQCILRAFIFILYLITYPIIRMRLKKRQYCPPVINNILFWPATEIAVKIRTKQITSEEVVSIFIARCKEVNPILNAIVENNFEKAIIQARMVDQFLKETSISEMNLEQDMPLLGVPVTVKASIAVKDFCYAVGEVSQKHVKAENDALVVANLRRDGAIILLTSNVPEYCMSWETMNNITGRTLNPYDTRRTPGGSTGGEGALISSAASVIGVASDVAGSARLPAMFCGVFGHKPSSNWVSSMGHKPVAINKTWNSIFTISVMTRYAVDIPLILKSIATCDECKKYLNTKVDINKIKVYYITDELSAILCSPIDEEIKVAIRNVVEHLNSTFGCPIKQLKLQNMKYAFEITAVIPSEVDKLETIYNLGDGSKPWKSVFIVLLKRLFRLNLHTSTSIIYGFIFRILKMLPSWYHKAVTKKRDVLKKELKEILDSNSVLICPTFNSCAYYHSEMYTNILNIGYMTIFNALSFPVTQCPMGLNSKGLPIGLQLVANDKCDNLTITLAKEIENKFGGWQLPPSNTNKDNDIELDNGYTDSNSKITRKMNKISSTNNIK